MAPLLQYFSPRKVLLFYFVFVAFTYIFSCAYSESYHKHDESRMSIGSRKMLEIDYEDELPKKKTTTTLSSKDSKAVIKPSLSTKNQTKLAKAINLSSRNQTKSTKDKSSVLLTKSEFKKLNSTSKSLNSTKTSTTSSKKSSDLLKLSSAKDKTSKAADTLLKKNVNLELEDYGKPKKKQSTEKESQTIKKKQSSVENDLDKNKKRQKDVLGEDEVKSKKKQSNTEKESSKKVQDMEKMSKGKKKSSLPSWVDQDGDDDDIVSELRDLPIRFQQTLIPDLERISTTSRAYLNKASKELTRGVKPYVGNKYASSIASFVSFAFILIPFILVSLVFNKIKAYFSIQKIIIFIQVYLAIYFSILGFTSLVTGLEPLKFFYATSRSTYICLQVLQTLGYVFYLLLLLMYLILVFSTDCGLSSKVLALAQTFVGFAVGLHYYIAVFHRMVLHQPPKANWKIHGIYALCFFSICMLSRAERRKKMYLEEDGEEGKQS